MNKEQRIKSAIKQVADYVYGDQETDNGFIEYIAQQYDGTIRENSVKAKFGLQDFDPVDDFGLKLDAFNLEDGKYVEIKSTQGRYGSFSFQFQAAHDKADMMEKLNPWIYVAGFHPNSGKCAYTVRFRYKGSEVAKRLREDCDRKVKPNSRSKNPKNRPSDWKHYITGGSFEILYFSLDRARETICKDFFKNLVSKFYQSYSKDDLIDMLINGTTPTLEMSHSNEPTPDSKVDLIISDYRAKGYKGSHIADHLNNLGFKTGSGKSWTAERVHAYTYYRKNKSASIVKSDYQSRLDNLFNENRSNSEIATILNSEGYTTRQGTKWRRSTVARHTSKLKKAA